VDTAYDHSNRHALLTEEQYTNDVVALEEIELSD
jgi:hypothetical protein